MNNVLSYIRENRIIAIIRGAEVDKVTEIAKALAEGGVYCIEVTFNQSGRPEDTAESIRRIIALGDERICVGAGTVLTAQQVTMAKDAGAKYIISPNTNLEVIRLTKELGMVSIPGAFTPTEIVAAYDAGADIVKLFPAGNLGTAYIKAIRAPINHIPLSAVGGVSLENILDFRKAGIECFGIGSNIIDKKAVEAGDYRVITEKARAYTEKLRVEV